jgi:hypothetical protein
MKVPVLVSLLSNSRIQQMKVAGLMLTTQPQIVENQNTLNDLLSCLSPSIMITPMLKEEIEKLNVVIPPPQEPIQLPKHLAPAFMEMPAIQPKTKDKSKEKEVPEAVE